MEQMTPELLQQLRQAAPLVATANTLSISGNSMKAAALMTAAGSLQMLLDVIDRQQVIIEQHKQNMHRVLEATVGELTRRAAPHAYESMAWNAGMAAIDTICSEQPLADCETQPFNLALHLLDRVNVDNDDQQRVDQVETIIKDMQAELDRRSAPLQSTLQLRKLLEEAFDRIRDLMEADDGQASKEAERFVERARKATLSVEPAVALQPVAQGNASITLPVDLVGKAVNGATDGLHPTPFCPNCGSHHDAKYTIAQLLPGHLEK